MNIQGLLLLSSLALVSLTLRGQEHYLDRYPVDPEIAAILDEHSDEIAQKLDQVDAGSKKHGVWTFDWLPDYYVKYGLARIAGVEKMQEAITRFGLSSLTVADKRLYHIKSAPQELTSRNYAVVIKRVKAQHNVPPITLDEMKQLCTLMHATGYISLAGPLSKKGPNYIRVKGGKFCLIDTESRYEPERLLLGFMRILRTHDFSRDLSEDALKLVFLEIRQLLEKQPEEILPTLAQLRRYMKEQVTEPSWNYKKFVKHYFKDLKKSAEKRALSDTNL